MASGAVSRAEGVFQEVILIKGVKPNINTYNSLIYGYCTSGQWNEVIRMLNEMSTQGLQPDVVTYL
jgi:leucine-rich PPR motif-containing protein